VPNCRVSVVDPVSSSVKPHKFTIAVDYDYPSGQPTPAYLLVRCKDTDTIATLYTYPIETTTGATAQPQQVVHESNFTDVEVEARISTSEEWGGTVLASSLADDIDIQGTPAFFQPDGFNLTKQVLDKLFPGQTDQRGFLDKAMRDEFNKEVGAGLNDKRPIQGKVGDMVTNVKVHAVLYSRREPKEGEIKPTGGAKHRKTHKLGQRPVRILNGGVKDGQWYVDITKEELKKGKLLVVFFTYDVPMKPGSTMTMSLAVPK
jgi:hypothetical protein